MASPNVVFIGVSGCGKSTVAALFARAAGARLVEADDFHPPASITRMSAGEPLTDEDRVGWLDAIADRIAQAMARGEPLVLACSALKRAYRDRLRRADPGLVFVLLDGRASCSPRASARAADTSCPPASWKANSPRWNGRTRGRSGASPSRSTHRPRRLPRPPAAALRTL